MAAGSGEATQRALQAVAQGTRWTYSLLWRLCPRQGALVWAEGHYNGAIKTRKTTVQLAGADDGEEEEEVALAAVGSSSGGRAARRRSRQLRELYDFLAREAATAAADGGGGGGGGAAARRPCAALAPEDLAETEWFYLMCASYCFPPGLGLPGKAFATRGHVWLAGANQVDSKVFSRAILAKSAGIQTVACIPVADGVLEIGTTEKVEEDIGLIQYARSIFMDQHGVSTPALSGHSTSNSTPMTVHIDESPAQIERGNYITGYKNVHDQPPHNNLNNPEDKRRGEFDDDDDDQLDMECCASDRARYGCPSYVDEGMDAQRMLPQINSNNAQTTQWDLLYQNLCNTYLDPAAEDQAIPPENAHYAETVLRVIRHNTRQQAASGGAKTYLALSKSSSFTRWNAKRPADLESMMMVSDCAPGGQRVLKAILFNNVSSSREFVSKFREEVQSPDQAAAGEGTSRARNRGQHQQAELVSGGSHVLKERRRREKLNERFVVLRSLVPFVTKMDRASILGDTIEYLKELRRRIQDLESARPRQAVVDGAAAMPSRPPPTSRGTRGGDFAATCASSAGMRAAMMDQASVSCSSSSSSSSSAGLPAGAAVPAAGTEVQVFIIESDALLELRCPHRDGLLLRVMQALHRDLRMEVTSVQASSAGGVLLAELRAKVNSAHGRRSSIAEVKRALHFILSSD